jgi:uncharacterized glyoxalase superfamily protein PhnB
VGFELLKTYEDDGNINWALLSFGNDSVMFNAGGSSSNAERREVDLYLQVANVDEVFHSLKDRVEIHDGPSNRFYGMRELIIRDLNRFWVTFGQPMRTTLDYYEQQARELVTNCESRAANEPSWRELFHEIGVDDSEGISYLKEHHPVLGNLSPTEILETSFGSADAQWVVARLNNVNNWDALVSYVQSREQEDSSREAKEFTRTLSPMIHVPDVRAAVEWYKSAGFHLVGEHGENGELDWAMLTFGDGSIMFSEGRKLRPAERRELDLYIYAENVPELFEQWKRRAEICRELADTFYGMKEFTVRDLNGVWVIFGEQNRAASHV